MWTTGHSLLREPKRENCFSDSGPNPVNRSGYRWVDVQLQAQGRSISTYYYLVSIWLSDRLGTMPKRNLVLAEDCAGLGSLKESCKLPDWPIVVFHLLFDFCICTLPIYLHSECRTSTKACRATKSCVLCLWKWPKAPSAVEKALQARVGFERCYEKDRYPVHLGFQFKLNSCWESKSTKQYKQIVQHS